MPKVPRRRARPRRARWSWQAWCPTSPRARRCWGKVREVYGADRVVDQLGVGPLVAPPNWSQQVQKLINPELRKVSKGELRINGNVIDVAGNVDNEATRQQLVSTMITQLANPTYTVRNGLRVGVPDQQVLDAALANRTIAFQPGNALLTPAGMQVLDELLPVLRNFKERRFEIVGHTDGQGQRQRNVILSEERANAVRAYLVSKGHPGYAVRDTRGRPRHAGGRQPDGRRTCPQSQDRVSRVGLTYSHELLGRTCCPW